MKGGERLKKIERKRERERRQKKEKSGGEKGREGRKGKEMKMKERVATQAAKPLFSNEVSIFSGPFTVSVTLSLCTMALQHHPFSQ